MTDRLFAHVTIRIPLNVIVARSRGLASMVSSVVWAIITPAVFLLASLGNLVSLGGVGCLSCMNMICHLECDLLSFVKFLVASILVRYRVALS